jgi:hypothetical protein
MAAPPEQKTSKASVEASLASKAPFLARLPPGMSEQHLERCAKNAYPGGSEQERDEFKRYWRERIDRERECSDRERERSDRAAEQQLQTLKVSSETLPRLQDRGNGEVSVDESKIAKFRLRQARLRSDNELKQHFTGVRAINRAMRDPAVIPKGPPDAARPPATMPPATKKTNATQRRLSARLKKLKAESNLPWRTIAKESGASYRWLLDIQSGRTPSADMRKTIRDYFSRVLERPIRF